MPISPFLLERYFAQYEFKLKYLLSPSDCESLSMAELLQMAAPASLDLWQGLRLSYTESQGHPLLRSEVARLYQHIPAENVIIAAPEEAIFIAMQTLLRPGDHVVAISPAYQSLYEIARSIGCELTNWCLEPGPNANWQLDLDQLEDSLTARTRLLVINFPHNPTGYTLTRSELDSVIRLARQHGLYLFSDEMYRLLEYEPVMRLPAVCDIYEKGISLSGLSKSFALPGLRIGWLATQDSALMEGWLTFRITPPFATVPRGRSWVSSHYRTRSGLFAATWISFRKISPALRSFLAGMHSALPGSAQKPVRWLSRSGWVTSRWNSSARIYLKSKG